MAKEHKLGPLLAPDAPATSLPTSLPDILGGCGLAAPTQEHPRVVWLSRVVWVAMGVGAGGSGDRMTALGTSGSRFSNNLCPWGLARPPLWTR